MGAFELFCTLGAEDLHHEENYVGDVAFDELVDKAGSLDLVKNGINLVGLRTDVLKYVIYFRGVEHQGLFLFR